MVGSLGTCPKIDGRANKFCEREKTADDWWVLAMFWLVS